MKKGDVVIAVQAVTYLTIGKEYLIVATIDSENIIAVRRDDGTVAWQRGDWFKLKPRLVCVHKRVSRRANESRG